ncbi:galanin peptides [Electrophorus electricus]|uniref:galanin peptides n=1 Tax=Electrophorus electricus TaxID=8005 RepID=UPI0015CF8D96|nr:galanin peptides [Electrophorus electricus]
MSMSCILLCVCLCVLSAQLRTHGMALTGPEKRGWTLNSAGYLLGPYAHRTLMVRHGAAQDKRSSWEEQDMHSSLSTHQPSHNESYLQSLLELLMYLRIKENGMTEDFNSSIFNDDITQ